MSDTPKCIKCHSSRGVRPHGDRDWFCLDCKIIFDAEDDGTVGYGPPDRRINREERRATKPIRIRR